jgi:hypothetical protein
VRRLLLDEAGDLKRDALVPAVGTEEDGIGSFERSNALLDRDPLVKRPMEYGK